MSAKVLIVDDDKALCEELSESLKNEGYDVDTSYNGFEGEELASSGDFDVLLLDVDLPNLNGIEILKNLKSGKAVLPVIIVTGKPFADLKDELGLADGFAAKPFNMLSLIDMVKKATEKKHILPGS